MIFQVLPVNTSVKNEPNGKVYLVTDNWNDWWEFRVLYQVYYKDSEGDVAV